MGKEKASCFICIMFNMAPKFTKIMTNIKYKPYNVYEKCESTWILRLGVTAFKVTNFP